MIRPVTRMASLVLAFGFFIGCSALSPDNTKSADGSELNKQQLEQRIETIEERLEEDSSNPQLHLEKGSLLRRLALKLDNPSDRTPLYTDLRQSLLRAEDNFREEDHRAGQREVDELFNIAWSNEHNRGVRYMQQDSSRDSNDFEKAVHHFVNATVILPDSSISYEMQARAFYKLHQPEKAIEALEQAKQHIDPLPPFLLEQLAFLYMETGSSDKAVTLYEQAKSLSDNNLNLIHGLANAYITKDEHRKAIDLLELLIENKPESIIYGKSLATELFYLGSENIETAIDHLKKGTGDESELLNEADSLINKAENRFLESLKVNPDDYELERGLAYFYQNSASKYQKLLPYLAGNAEEAVEEKIRSYLRSSIPYFLKLAEQNPRESNFLENLYDIYTYLGMDEKAAETKAKLN